MTKKKCRHCKKEWVAATSPTTGCCDEAEKVFEDAIEKAYCVIRNNFGDRADGVVYRLIECYKNSDIKPRKDLEAIVLKANIKAKLDWIKKSGAEIDKAVHEVNALEEELAKLGEK